MKRCCIAIVDAGHARLYTYDWYREPPPLREVRDLVNLGRHSHGDHHPDHITEAEARFAHSVIGELARIGHEHGFDQALVVGAPQMLGALRGEYIALHRAGIAIDEIPQDLAWLTSSQLHDHLAAMHLLAPRPRAAFVRAARPR